MGSRRFLQESARVTEQLWQNKPWKEGTNATGQSAEPLAQKLIAVLLRIANFQQPLIQHDWSISLAIISLAIIRMRYRWKLDGEKYIFTFYFILMLEV